MLHATIAAALILAALATLVGPIAWVVVLRRRTGMPLALAGLGAATFFVFQCVLRLPWQLPLAAWLQPRLVGRPVLAALFLVFSATTAALFEEVGRFVVLRRFVPRHTARVGLMFGAGHGGFEAVLLVGVTLAATAFLYTAFLLGHTLGLPPEVVATLRAAFRQITVLSAVSGVSERAGAMAFHTAATLLVVASVRGGTRRGLYIALAYHALSNVVLVAAGVYLIRRGLTGTKVALDLAFFAANVALVRRFARAF